MAGGLIQLVKSEQDNYLIGNPKITYFKIVYHRHTNFAMECSEIPLGTNPGTNEEVITTLISKTGDLLHKMHFDILLEGTESTNAGSYINWTNSTGYAYIKEISIQIGSQKIDTHYSEWFDIWNELTDPNMKEHTLVNKHNGEYLTGNATLTPPNLQMYVPLQFWFCKNAGLSLPLISLQNTDVKLITTFRKLNHLINCEGYASNQITPPTVKLYGDFIYLDTDERRRFSTESLDYLIEQLQYNQLQPLTNKYQLNFNHHIKELIWVCKDSRIDETDPTIENATVDATLNKFTDSTWDGTHGNDYFNYSPNANSNPDYIYGITHYEPFSTAKITIENSNRISSRKSSYFRTLQQYNHHSNVSSKGIYVYSFALKPEEYQPSGFINFSKLNNVNLELTNPITNNMNILIFATNYNVLRFSGGTAGLAYIS